MWAIVARLVNACWFCFKWSLILIVIGAALAVPYFYNRLDEEIRARVEARIAQHYPGLRVKLRSAVLLKGEGIQLRGLSILDPSAEGPSGELIAFDECFIVGPTDWQDLLEAEPEVTRVVLRRPTLRTTRLADGTWSAAKLLPLPRFSKTAPETRVENATIEISDPLKIPSGTLTLRDVNLTLMPAASGDRALPAPTSRRIQGTLSGDYFRHVVFDGAIDPHHPQYDISGSVEGLEIGPEMREALPGIFAEKLAALGTLRGQGELSFRVSYEPSRPTPLAFNLAVRLSHGRLDDPRLPHPLTEIRAMVRLNNEGYAIEDLNARSNKATLRIVSCRGRGLQFGGPMELEAEVRQLDLDRPLLEALPSAALQDQWRRYSPDGQVDANVRLSFDGLTWKPEITISCLNVSFAHYKFPYRLEHGTGTLRLTEDLLQTQLQAYSGNQLVRITSEWRHPLSGPCGWIEAKGEDLPLDKKLLDALPEHSQAVLKALDVRGTIGIHFRLWRDAADQPYHQHLLVNASRCWLKYEKFPYALSNIHGALEMTDGRWVFRNLEGNNGTARVLCQGSLSPTPQGSQLLLGFQATDVALGEELCNALQPGMRQVWHGLNPRGVIDLEAQVQYLDQPHQVNVSVRARPRGKTVSIEPTSFPYRLENLQGVFNYANGRATWEHLKAEHGLVNVASTGFCEFSPDASWHLRFDNLTVDRLRADRELVQAVPARLKKALVELNLSGPMSLRGTFDLARGGAAADPVRSQWNLAIGLQQVGADCGVRLENIHGGLTLVGGFDGQRFHSQGELALDSLVFKEYQFTEVMGPLWIDDQRALLGTWVDRRDDALPQQTAGPRRPRPLTAKIFGGTLYGDAWVTLGAQPQYGLRANLVDGDLARLVQEAMPGRHDLQGRLMGSIDLRGVGRSRNFLTGRGNIQLRDANVYELPQMLAMLKLLSIRKPDPNAFSKSDIDFAVQGEHIYFHKLDFTGDAISLLGKGEMDFNSDLRLVFTPIVGRGELGLPLLRDFFTGASQQLMVIRVGGTLQKPDMKKEALPGMNQPIQQLQAQKKDERPTGALPGFQR